MLDFLAFLFPRRCVFCRVNHADGLCLDCQDKLPWREPVKADAAPVIAPLFYRDAVRLALHRYKFRGYSGYAAVFGELAAQAVKASGAEADVVAWVPCGLFRRWRRGYDQSRLLALAVAGQLGLPAEKLLVKTRSVKSQTKMKDDAARRENVRGVFKAHGSARDKRVLLVDDIRTSGATMNEARATLLSAGAAKVYPCAVASK
ncbi:MAG: ComF family protein [Oscillospiraceae bacterium]|nr:ComF family protein [Oscillospiraceae bacterium]